MAKKGEFVAVSYTGTVKDTGKIFDLTSEETAKKNGVYDANTLYGPVTVVVGEGHLLKPLDKALEDMSVGDEKTIIIEPTDAFGPRDPKKVQLVPEKYFMQQNVRPSAGMVVEIGGLLGKVQSNAGGRVLVDLNHPLSGKALEYKMKVEKLVTEPTEMLKGIFNLHFRKPGRFEVNVNGGESEITIMDETDVPRTIMKRVSEDSKKFCGMKKVKFVYELS